MTPKPCLECGELFTPEHSSQQMFCIPCKKARDRRSKYQSKRRISGCFPDIENKKKAGAYGSLQVISCPGDEWPIGAMLDKMSLEYTLAAGYMPAGMRLRNLSYGYEVMVQQADCGMQKLTRIET